MPRTSKKQLFANTQETKDALAAAVALGIVKVDKDGRYYAAPNADALLAKLPEDYIVPKTTPATSDMD
jgi:hypothetical protein